MGNGAVGFPQGLILQHITFTLSIASSKCSLYLSFPRTLHEEKQATKKTKQVCRLSLAKTHRCRCECIISKSEADVALASSPQLRPPLLALAVGEGGRVGWPAVKFPQFPPFPLPFKPFLPPHHSSKTFASRAEMGSVFWRRRKRFSRYFYKYLTVDLGNIFYFSDRCLSLPPLRLSASPPPHPSV